MARKRNIPALKKELLVQIQHNGNVTMSAANVGVPRTVVYDWLRKDIKFKIEFENAYAIGVNLLVDEAQRRAYHGTMVPIYHGGIIVGYNLEYSDRLLEFMLKSQKRDVFGDKTEVYGSGEGGEIKFQVKLKKSDGDKSD